MLRPGCAAPSGLTHEAFTAVPLSSANVDLDYAAYMASPDVIRIHSDRRWPVDGFTAEQDRELVAIHEADHNAGRAFTFLLHHPHRSESVGCLYLNPFHDYLERAGADAETLRVFPEASAMVTFWIRQDLQQAGLAGLVAAAVNSWIIDAWPVDAHVFRILPGEHSSRDALEGLGLRRLTLHLARKRRPYLWYQPG